MTIRKKTVALLLAAALFLMSGVGVYAARLGDVDADGRITASDARLALRASVGLEEYTAGSAKFVAADADRDGVITAADARLLLRVSVGLHLLPYAPDAVQSQYIDYLELFLNGLAQSYSRSNQFKKSFASLGIQYETQVASSVPNNIPGILSAFIDDLDGDSIPELLVVRLAVESTYYSTQVELYRVKNQQAQKTLTLPINGGIINNLDRYDQVYLTLHNGQYYICDLSRTGSTVSKAEDAYRLQVFRINANDTCTEMINLYSSKLNGTKFNNAAVTDVASAISANKALFSSVGLGSITAANYNTVPTEAGWLFECGTYFGEKAVKVVDYSGFLAG